MRPTAKILLAGVMLASLAACETTEAAYVDPRHPWEVDAWASKRSDGLYEVRAVTVAPDTCYAPGEIRSAPSNLAGTIDVQVNLVRAANGPCSQYLTDVMQDLPALKLEPDDRQVQLVVFADGAEKNRAIVDLANVRPIPGPYAYRYDPRDPRYVRSARAY